MSRISSDQITAKTPLKRIRRLDFEDARAIILFGPRKTGKTTLLRALYPKAKLYDLLLSDLRTDLTLHPNHLREWVLAEKPAVILLDEIQKVPELLNEVHWLLENTETRVVLCGSSPRKLKRGAANLLGGRAFQVDLFPLVYPEIPDLDIERILNQGLIPQHYLGKSSDRFLKAYINQYLQEEIIEESRIRKIQAFHRFLEVAALMNGELLNYANVASDCGVSAKSIREYYQILTDTLLGFPLSPWSKVKTRKLIETEKYYLFDCGVVRWLRGISHVPPKTKEFGNLFETWMLSEIRAFLSYHELPARMSFWRTTSNFEVDLIVGDMDVAIEFKGTDTLRSDDPKGLRALAEEHRPRRSLIVSLEKKYRKLPDGIELMHFEQFLKELWSGRLIRFK